MVWFNTTCLVVFWYRGVCAIGVLLLLVLCGCCVVAVLLLCSCYVVSVLVLCWHWFNAGFVKVSYWFSTFCIHMILLEGKKRE